jgi:hypothetical protein
MEYGNCSVIVIPVMVAFLLNSRPSYEARVTDMVTRKLLFSRIGFAGNRKVI